MSFKIENEILIEYTGNEKEIVIPDGVKAIGEEVFQYADITSVILSDSVTEIGYSAFRSCDSLEKVVLPESLVAIGDAAFYNCDSMETLILPKTLKGIGNQAFWGCSKLSNIEIPEDIEFIGESAFVGCKGLADENGFIIFENILHGYVGNDENVVIPNGVTYISTFAFHELDAIKSVVIPGTVTAIRKEAFYECKNLTDIFVPKSARHLSRHAFGWFYDNLTIHGVAGSVIEEYAQGYGINFVADFNSRVYILGNNNFTIIVNRCSGNLGSFK